MPIAAGTPAQLIGSSRTGARRRTGSTGTPVTAAGWSHSRLAHDAA
jgi:hypothetical protein